MNANKIKPQELNKAIALAGIFQAAYLVNQIALGHNVEEQPYLTSLKSIFVLTPESVLSVYESLTSLHTGLMCLKKYSLQKSPFTEKNMMRYILPMIGFARKILMSPEISKQLQRRLVGLTSQTHHLGIAHDIILRDLTSIYRQVFSYRKMRIQIIGKLSVLKDPHKIEQIHSLLIAGIRSAVLWRQLGGKSWQLLLNRKKLSIYTDFLLHHEKKFLS